MHKEETRSKQVIAAFIGLGAAALFTFIVLAGTVQAAGNNSKGSDPQLTLTPWPTMPWPTWWPSPPATRTPCSTCTSTPTRPPWTPPATWTRDPSRTPPPPPPTSQGTLPPHTPPPTRTHEPTRTPPGPPPTAQGTVPPRPRLPFILQPFLQFGHAQPGGIAMYRQVLFNRFTSPTMVDLHSTSLGGWTTSVNPEHITVDPGTPTAISVTVGVPVSPTYLLDVERTTATSAGVPGQASAYMITLVGRHPFADTPSDHWADDPIQYLVAQNVVSGYSDGTFRPNNYLTRAQFAKMLVGAVGWSIQTPASASFRDVTSDMWAYGYIETAAAHGVISGYSDGTFRPNETVTRAQVAKMIVTARQWTPDTAGSVTFSDLGTENWAYGYAQAMNAAGVMSGYSDGTFRPYASATRAQIAKIITYSLFATPNN